MGALGCLSQLRIRLLTWAQVLILDGEFKPHVGLHAGVETTGEKKKRKKK